MKIEPRKRLNLKGNTIMSIKRRTSDKSKNPIKRLATEVESTIQAADSEQRIQKIQSVLKKKIKRKFFKMS